MSLQKLISRKTGKKLVFCWRLEALKVNDNNSQRHGSATLVVDLEFILSSNKDHFLLVFEIFFYLCQGVW
jgi:hypothetical protein